MIRGEGHSLTSAVSSLAGCATPFVVHLGQSNTSLPLVIYGACCLLAAFCALLLPETANQDLPESLEDGEAFGRDMTWKDFMRFPVPDVKKTRRSNIKTAELRVLNPAPLEALKPL